MVEYDERRKMLTQIEKINHALSASTFAWLAAERVRKIGRLIHMGLPMCAIRSELDLCDYEVRMVEHHVKLATS